MTTTNTYKRLRVGLFLALALVAFAMYGAQVRADSETVTSGAEVSAPSALPPYIECAWALPDMRPDLGGIQYDTNPGDHKHDYDFGTVTPGYPCDNDPTNADESQRNPDQAQGVRHMITVLPTAEDEPEPVWVQVWGAADHDGGINQIQGAFWKVYHPDGSFKLQVHARNDTATSTWDGTDGPKTHTFNYQGGMLTPGVDCLVGHEDMWHAAWHTEQVTDSAIHDASYGLQALCEQQQKKIFYSSFPISKHQPCGEYRIDMHAVSQGQEYIKTIYIDVVCFFNLELDFQNVNWGTLTPGQHKVIGGNTDFSPPNSTTPTVKNTGNSAMGVGVRFHPLVQQNVVGPKEIREFDVAFGHSAGTLQHIGFPGDPGGPVQAGEVVWFDNNPSRVLCTNQVGKLDFSIYPPADLPAGTYLGNIDILAESRFGVCPEDLAAHVDFP